ncbi:lipid-A-disaccharide synthase [Bacteroidia bacterium]|nr:lipid-A-disaccharide synthase [Bacteroidia bacterium]
MKYFLIVGEASGDLHASNLMQSLQNADPAADFRYFGGDLMQAVGGTLIRHYRDMAYMGFIPVLMHLRTVFRNMELCQQAIRDYQPDVVILVDYAGFNLRIAKYLKSKPFLSSCTAHHVPFTCYYISPKIWAWKEYRIHAIKKYIDRMLCILPFEVEFYKKHHYEVDYVGNPTVDAIAGREYASETFETFTQANHLTSQPIIALLAGSRKQEIKDNLPAMLDASVSFKEYQLVIAGAPGIAPDDYQPFIKDYPVRIVFGQTYRLLQQSRAALVTSGTATLETALLRVPQTVCYRLPFAMISSFVFQRFFSCKYISLVNLIAGKSVVKELYGKDFSIRKIREELGRLLNDGLYREQMQQGYQEVIDRLDSPGASETAAREIIACFRNFRKK